MALQTTTKQRERAQNNKNEHLAMRHLIRLSDLGQAADHQSPNIDQ